MDSNRALRAVERIGELQATLHLYDLSPPWAIDPTFLNHRSPHCRAIKMQCRDRCIALDSAHTRETITQGPFLKSCHGDLREVVTPITYGERVVGALFLGELAPGSGTEADDLHALANLLKGEIERNLQEQPGQRTGTIGLFLSRKFRDSSLSLSDLADHLGLSASRASQLIRSEFGTTFPRLLRAYRLENGKNLLLYTDLPVEQIAHESGFATGSYFHKTFRKDVGTTPSAFRAGGTSLPSHRMGE